MAAEPAFPDWIFRDGGFYTREPALGPLLSGEIVLGRMPEPGNTERPNRGTVSFGGFYASPADFSAGQAAARTASTGAHNVLEMVDPAESWVIRTIGENLFWRTGFSREGWFRRHPVGWSTLLAKDHTGGDTSLWIRNGRHFPETVATLPSGITFKVGGDSAAAGQAITYDSNTAAEVVLSGSYAVGATEMFVENATAFPTGPMSGNLGNVSISWEDQATVLSAVVDGDHLAGETSLAITGDAGELAAIPDAGRVSVLTAGDIVRGLNYTAKAVVSTSATLTLASELTRSIPSGNPTTMDKLTGITSDYGTWIVPKSAEGDWTGIAPGATTIQLDLGIGSTDPPPVEDIAALWATVPSSGTILVETEVRNPAGGALMDHPWQRIAYTAKASDGTLTLAAPLPFRISGNELPGWARVEGVPGLTKPARGSITAHRLDGVTGFASNATGGGIVAFNPRYRGWTPADAALGFFVGGATSPSGPDSFATLLSSKTLADVDNESAAQGQFIFTAQNSQDTRVDIATLEKQKGGIIGLGTEDERDRLYKWTVGGPLARGQLPGVLDAGAGTVSVTSLTLAEWPSSTFFPDARRLLVTPFNNVSQASEIRIFEYLDLDLDNDAFTGVSFDQAAQGPKATTLSPQTLPTTPITVDSTSPGGFASDRFPESGKLRALVGRALVARMTYTGRTDTTFTGVALGSSIDFLAEAGLMQLTSHLRLADTSGSTAVARVGFDGHYNGAPGLAVTGLVTSDSDKAVHLNSGHTGDSIELFDSLIGVKGVVGMIFKWASGSGSLVADNTAAGSGWHIGYDHGGTFAVRVAGTQLDTSLATAAVRDGNRHTIFVSKDGDDVWVFVDGAQVAHSTGFADTAAVSRWLVGRDGSDTTYVDLIADELMISDQPMTADEAAILHSVITTGPLSGSGTVPSGATVEEDYALSDFYLADDRIGLCLEAPYPVIGTTLGMAANAGLHNQTQIGAYGPLGEPGIQFGRTDPATLYFGSDGELHALVNGVDKLVSLT